MTDLVLTDVHQQALRHLLAAQQWQLQVEHNQIGAAIERKIQPCLAIPRAQHPMAAGGAVILHHAQDRGIVFDDQSGGRIHG